MTSKEREALKSADYRIEEEKRIQEFKRLEVVDMELDARSNKAAYEKMYYYLEAAKIQPEFIKVVNERNAPVVEQQELVQKEEDFETVNELELEQEPIELS